MYAVAAAVVVVVVVVVVVAVAVAVAVADVDTVVVAGAVAEAVAVVAVVAVVAGADVHAGAEADVDVDVAGVVAVPAGGTQRAPEFGVLIQRKCLWRTSSWVVAARVPGYGAVHILLPGFASEAGLSPRAR